MKIWNRRNSLTASLALATWMLSFPALAADLPTFDLTIKDAKFTPETIEVPANTKFRLKIKNEGPGPEEFESSELHKEKVLAEGASSFIIFQPLKPGTYQFIGEFHPKTAKGQIVVK